MKDVDTREIEYKREKIDAILLSGLCAQFFSPYLFEAINRADESKDAKILTTRWKELKAKLKNRITKQF
jgi:hypothetical protein